MVSFALLFIIAKTLHLYHFCTWITTFGILFPYSSFVYSFRVFVSFHFVFVFVFVSVFVFVVVDFCSRWSGSKSRFSFSLLSSLSSCPCFDPFVGLSHWVPIVAFAQRNRRASRSSDVHVHIHVSYSFFSPEISNARPMIDVALETAFGSLKGHRVALERVNRCLLGREVI